MKLRHKVAIGAMAALPILAGGVAYASTLNTTTTTSGHINVNSTTPINSGSPDATVDSGPDLKTGSNVNSGPDLNTGPDVKSRTDAVSGPDLNSGPNLDVQSGSQSTVGVDSTGGASA